ncbi:MAG: 5'-nucleotidase SurE [Phycisphaeraceae bacterium]|nr:MAG: 5'-nucleotidase SurE [Phycisphaeraceae bacterium]
MNILLTNDDGIRAPGILSLHRALAGAMPGHAADPLGEITTIAPATVQSATSHGITFHEPLMTRPADVNGSAGIAVDGRPADCVKVGLTNLWPERFGDGSLPDLVISGMNAGANCGINVIYSGTVAAALEAAFLGVPAIAVSLHLEGGYTADAPSPDFDRAALLARRIIDTLLAGGLPNRHEVLSINLPATGSWADPDSVEIVACPMNTHALVDKYERRTAPDGSVYYWAAGHGLDFVGADDGTDVAALFERKATVTPLKFDLTREDRLGFWRDRLS